MDTYHKIKLIVQCPYCHNELTYQSEEVTPYGTKTGKVRCVNCINIVASIQDYKLDFIRVEKEIACSVAEKIPKREDKHKGNGFPTRFLELITEVPEDGLILDFGGGPRQRADRRYINFEYSEYDEVDVFGDGHFLPFKDNTFDLIQSQAVMEHVYNPFQVAKELYRVTKPGGVVYVESAFMQPLHGVPSHYFNTTIWGLEELFKDYIKRTSGWFGNYSDLIDWMLKSTGIANKTDKWKVDTIMGLFKEFDQISTYDEMKPIAIGVYFEGIKM